jgi:hypothetical protein
MRSIAEGIAVLLKRRGASSDRELEMPRIYAHGT